MGVVCVGGVGIRRLSGCGVCGWGGDQETEWVCVGGVGIRRLSGCGVCGWGGDQETEWVWCVWVGWGSGD